MRFLVLFLNNDFDNIGNVGKKLWSHVKVSGAIPPPVFNHTVELIGSYLYLFGGSDGSSSNNDLYVLDICMSYFSFFLFFFSFLLFLSFLSFFYLFYYLATWEWTKPTTEGGVPPIRSGHSSCVVNKSLLIFGGVGAGILYYSLCYYYYYCCYITQFCLFIINVGFYY